MQRNNRQSEAISMRSYGNTHNTNRNLDELNFSSQHSLQSDSLTAHYVIRSAFLNGPFSISRADVCSYRPLIQRQAALTDCWEETLALRASESVKACVTV